MHAIYENVIAHILRNQSRTHGSLSSPARWGCAGLVCGFATLASAQTPPQDSAGVIDEVVVTAQRREQNMQDVPISIAAFGEKQIAQLGATSLTQLENATPNLSFGTGGGSNKFIAIRGVGDFSRNIGNDARVGVYIDGVYQGRSYATDADLFDVERVEVLRGPQGTLFGRNTEAGAINITTRKPSYDLSSEFQAEYGNYDHMRGAARIDMPLVDNKAALSVSASHTQRDGFIRNTTLRKDLNGVDVDSGRVALRLDPSDALEILLRGDYLESDIDRQGASPQQGLSFPFVMGRPGTFQVAYNADAFDYRKIWGTSAEVNYRFAGDYVLTSITAYRDAAYRTMNDEDYTPLDVVQTEINEANTQFTQELRLASPSQERVDFVLGLYYLTQDIETNSHTQAGPILPVFIPGSSPGDVFTPGEVDTDAIAAFANVNFQLTERLELNAGLRYTREDKEIDYAMSDTTGVLFNLTGYQDSRSDSDWSPRLGLNFKVSEDVLLYASAARAAKSGGWNADFIQSVDQIAFDQEHATNIELGLKSMLFDDRVRANLAAFHTKFDDFQVFQFVPAPGVGPGTIITITNAGKLTSKGVEAELVVLPMDSLALTMSAAYTDVSFDEFRNGGGPGVHYDGNRPPFAPEIKAYASAEYSLGIGSGHRLVAFADYSYSDDYFTSPSNVTPGYHVDSFGLVSARLSFINAADTLEISVYSRNLTDKFYIRGKDTNVIGVPREQIESPRTYGVRAVVRFE